MISLSPDPKTNLKYHLEDLLKDEKLVESVLQLIVEYNNPDVEAVKDAAYQAGYDVGYNEGHKEGSQADEEFADFRYEQGYDASYEEGFEEGVASVET